MKIKISCLWILFIPIIVISKLYKIFLFLFLLMSVHESMHLLCAKKLGYEIEKVTLYPFGLCASILNFEYKNSLHEIYITVAGLLVHVLCAFILPVFYYLDIISMSFYMYLANANLSLLCFNLIPIYPLDGGRILRNVLEYVFPFKRAKFLSLLFSVFILICMYFYFPFTHIQKVVFTLLFFMQFISILYFFKEDVHTFYVYRFFHPIKKKIKIHAYEDLYKNKVNYIVKNGQIKSEKEVLHRWI